MTVLCQRIQRNTKKFHSTKSVYFIFQVARNKNMFWDLSGGVLLGSQRKVRSFRRIKEPTFIESWTLSRATQKLCICMFLQLTVLSYFFLLYRSILLHCSSWLLTSNVQNVIMFVFFKNCVSVFGKLMSCKYLNRLMSSTT